MVSYKPTKLSAPPTRYSIYADHLCVGPIILHLPIHSSPPLKRSRSLAANPISLGGMVGRHRSRSGHLAKPSRRIPSNEETRCRRTGVVSGMGNLHGWSVSIYRRCQGKRAPGGTVKSKRQKWVSTKALGVPRGIFLLIIIGFFFSPSFLFLFHHRVFQILCWIPFLVIRWRNL